jgi:tryptophanyl-tRNA synthetase
MNKPVLVSGVKPTGSIHIGNYFGAMKQFVDLVNSGTYMPYIFLADYHALNSVQDAQEMKTLTRELIAAYIAIGLDPKQVVLFKQSEVTAHTELCWIFDTITTMPYLMRSHAYKDAEAKGREVSVGTFNYPMLMAADILLYDADIVPVGQDQKQHIEYARDTAEKFNRIYGDTFKLPKEHIMAEVAVVPGTDGQKMSKSYGNTIPLFAAKDALHDAVMGIVTDSSGDMPHNVYAMHKLLKSDAELKPLYEHHKGKYKALKEALFEDLEALIAPMREKYEATLENQDLIDKVLADGGMAAREVATAKIKQVRKAIGVA